MTLKANNREFQELVRELVFIRTHNRAFKPGEPQDRLLLFAEGSVVLIVLERFLRMVLRRNSPTDVSDKDTLPNLLEKVTGDRLRLLRLPLPDRAKTIKTITSVRNTMLHGNYEQAAREAGSATVKDYFKTHYTPEVESLFRLVEILIGQIDPDSGLPR